MFSFVDLKVYYVLGKEVRTLINKNQNAGSYEVTFDGTGLPSSMYFYKLVANGVVIGIKKMLLIK